MGRPAPDFLRAYADAVAADVRKPRAAEGRSVAALVSRRHQSRACAELAEPSRKDRRRILEKIRKRHGDAPATHLQRRHSHADIDAMAPFAARNRVKAPRAPGKLAVRSNGAPTVRRGA